MIDVKKISYLLLAMNKLQKIVSSLIVATSAHVASMEATNFRVQFSDELKTAIRETIDAKIPEWREMMWSYDCPERVEKVYISLFKRVDRVLEERLQARVKNLNIDFHTCAKIADPSFECKEFQNKDFEKDELTHKYTLLYLSTQSSEETVKQAYKYLINDLRATIEIFFEKQEERFKSVFPDLPWFFDLKTKQTICIAIMNSCIKPLAKRILDIYQATDSFYQKVLNEEIPIEAASLQYVEKYVWPKYVKVLVNKNQINKNTKKDYYLFSEKEKGTKRFFIECDKLFYNIMQLSGYPDGIDQKNKQEISRNIFGPMHLNITFEQERFFQRMDSGLMNLYKKIFAENLTIEQDKAINQQIRNKFAEKKMVNSQEATPFIYEMFKQVFFTKDKIENLAKQLSSKIQDVQQRFDAVVDEIANDNALLEN